MNKLIVLLSIFLITFFLHSCKKIEEVKDQTIQPKIPVIKDQELEKWKESIKKEVYSIDINNLQNPFMTPKTYKILTQKEETIPLELVGILKKNGKKMALLQDPTRKGYILKEGDKIGKATIKEIGTDYLIIEEISENLFGVKSKKTKKITLKKERL
jgi:type IV pilus assembly protein PilP